MELQNSEKILKWLKTTRIPLTEISNKTGLSRSTLYNWLEGGVIRQRNESKLMSVYFTEIELTNTNIQLEGDNSIMDARYVIELQKDKIKMQQKEIQELSTQINEQNSTLFKLENNQKFYNEIFENTIPDVQEIVYVKGIFKNDIHTKHCNNVGSEKLLKALGLPVTDKDKYYSPDTWYKVHEHPIDQFIVEKSQKDLKDLRQLALEIFKGVKFIMGLDCLFVPITYQHKNNIVHTHTSLKFNLNMKNSHIVSKTIIISKEKLTDY